VLYHSAMIDPGVRYPPYSKHVFKRRIQEKFMP
jgi:aldehyde dehydrogenase (NAD+)